MRSTKGWWRSCCFGIGLLVWILIAPNKTAFTQEAPMTAEEWCVFDFGFEGCENMGRPGGGAQMVVAHFAAVAISPSSMTAGGAHGRNSLDDAEQTALQNCRRGGATDCRVLTWGENSCVALASSYSDKKYGFSVGANRTTTAADAFGRCRSSSGKNCIVAVSPCAGDDVQWSSPVPLPIGVQGGKVDPVLVGTWALEINPGRWIWRVASNGTYEFHSEAVDATPSNAGTLTAENGHYTLHAITVQWDDVGTYTQQSSGVVVATGKLGTGTWKKIAAGDPAIDQAVQLSPRPAAPRMTVRK